MKKTKIIMGMPVSLEIVDHADAEIFKIIFDYFKSVDEKFSTYKKTSEVSRINSGKVREEDCSLEMREILGLAEQTKRETDGYFDIFRNGEMDPSGIVKGWAVWKASEILKQEGIRNYYIDAGGDVQTNGKRGKKSAKII
jgi:thiamine biosynthesis lipoprotein